MKRILFLIIVVSLGLYDAKGKRVALLQEGQAKAGETKSIEVDGASLPKTHSPTLAWLRELGVPVSPAVDVAQGPVVLLDYYRRF